VADWIVFADRQHPSEITTRFLARGPVGL